MSLGQVLHAFGRHKPSRRFAINRGDGAEYALCIYCRKEIMRIGTYKWVRL